MQISNRIRLDLSTQQQSSESYLIDYYFYSKYYGRIISVNLRTSPLLERWGYSGPLKLTEVQKVNNISSSNANGLVQ